MVKTATERQRERRARLRASGAAQLHITLAPDVHQALRALAEAEGSDLNTCVSRCIMAHYKGVEPDSPAAQEERKLKARAQRSAEKAARAEEQIRLVEAKAELTRVEAIRAGANSNRFKPRVMERTASGVFIVTGHDSERTDDVA
ncbi:hypothetical protein JCM15519_01490 [Fundidesulfovibrio butyratiphilus]